MENVDKIMQARVAILKDLQRRALEQDPGVKPLDERYASRWHKPQDNYYSGAGDMPCPICASGVLSYRRASINGHVHARCSNEDCVSWVE